MSRGASRWSAVASQPRRHRHCTVHAASSALLQLNPQLTPLDAGSPRGQEHKTVTAFPAAPAANLGARQQEKRAGSSNIGQGNVQISLGATSRSGLVINDLPEDSRSLPPVSHDRDIGPPSLGVPFSESPRRQCKVAPRTSSSSLCNSLHARAERKKKHQPPKSSASPFLSGQRFHRDLTSALAAISTKQRSSKTRVKHPTSIPIPLPPHPPAARHPLEST